VHETRELVGHVRPHDAERRGRVGQHGQKGGRGAPGFERQSTGEHLVRDHAKGPHVRPSVDLRTLCLLRRHVGDRADDGAGFRHLHHGLRGVGNHLGEAEVENLYLAIARQHDVRGLQVAVDDAGMMRGGEAGCELQQDRGCLGYGHGAPLEPHPERLAFVERHRDEQLMVPVANLINGGDVRMVEGAGGLRFTKEARPRLRVLRDGRREKLERDLAVEACILREVHHTHSAEADRFQNAKVGDGRANQRLDDSAIRSDRTASGKPSVGFSEWRRIATSAASSKVAGRPRRQSAHFLVVELDLTRLEAVRVERSERLKWPRRLRCGRFCCGARGGSRARKGKVVQSTLSRRAFVTGLGMLSVPLFALAQDREKKEGDDKNREEKKKEAEKKAEEKKDEVKDKAEDADVKDKAEDAVDDRDKVVDGPGTDNSQDRRQDRRRDAVK
jgi:hypothetical protein